MQNVIELVPQCNNAKDDATKTMTIPCFLQKQANLHSRDQHEHNNVTHVHVRKLDQVIEIFRHRNLPMGMAKSLTMSQEFPRDTEFALSSDKNFMARTVTTCTTRNITM